MNERIQELAEQATTIVEHKNPQTGFTSSYANFNREKFAELIVRECIQVGGPEDSYTDEWFKAKADSVNKIKKHFGVE